MPSEQKDLKIGLGEASNKVRVRFFCWQHCLRMLNIGNTSSYPYTLSNAQQSHFCRPCSKGPWHFAGTNNNETGSRSPCMRQTTLPHFNFSVTAELNDVTSRLIILINEEINEANCMVRNSAKLDCRTKQHTQLGVSTSNGSRDMARTKSWRGKKKKK